MSQFRINKHATVVVAPVKKYKESRMAHHKQIIAAENALALPVLATVIVLLLISLAIVFVAWLPADVR